MIFGLATADWFVLCASGFVFGAGCGAVGLAILLAYRDSRADAAFWLERKSDFVDRDVIDAASQKRPASCRITWPLDHP